MSQSTYTLRCVERAVNYMSEETRDGNTPSLERIANAAGLSKFHFNRVYKLATGETPQETLTRFKLARATDQLKNPDKSVTDVAFSVGYGSSQAFAKALKRVLATSASSIRADEERLAKAIETLVVPSTAQSRTRSDLLIEIAKLDPFEAIAMRTDGTYPSLNVVYEALFAAAGGPQFVEAILGQPFGDIELDLANALRFDCALKLSSDALVNSHDQARMRILEGAYLLVRHTGAYDRLPESIDRLYLAALSQDEVQIGDAPLLFHYLDDPESTDEASLRTDIYLPVSA